MGIKVRIFRHKTLESRYQFQQITKAPKIFCGKFEAKKGKRKERKGTKKKVKKRHLGGYCVVWKKTVRYFFKSINQSINRVLLN